MNHRGSQSFKQHSSIAIHNQNLQTALGKLKNGLVHKRALAISKLPQFEAMRDDAVQMKNHTLNHLDNYLEQFEQQVLSQGGKLHWAKTDEDACKAVINICHTANAKLITKSKSMLSEEIGLNLVLESEGFEIVETDLGEYIIQLRKETPTHIVIPAIHVLKEEIAKDFLHHHSHLHPNRPLEAPEQLLKEARDELRKKFLTADVNITGANCLIAENGGVMIVTNEGNADLAQALTKVHIVIASIEKIVPTIEDAFKILRLLPRSATGQAITSYVTFVFGQRKPRDLEGPSEYHIILVDNGRRKMLGSEYQEMLRCIRCGACLNHCPVYSAVGGQTYGTTYPGPMGAVLSPSLFGIHHTNDLPNASTFCGKCEEVCPMKIPLPTMMRFYRDQEFQLKLSPKKSRAGLRMWGFIATRPGLYHTFTKLAVYFLYLLSKRKGKFRFLLFAKYWTQHRDFPAPQARTFHDLWYEHLKRNKNA